jgi:hypothetical protein
VSHFAIYCAISSLINNPDHVKNVQELSSWQFLYFKINVVENFSILHPILGNLA